MKRGILLFFVLAFTACTQCSKSKKKEGLQNQDDTVIEKTIKTFIIYANYSPEPKTIGNRYYEEYFQWLYEAYCYKTLEHYSPTSYPYKGDIVDGKLVTRIYKKDGSFFVIPMMVTKEQVNFKLSEHGSLYVDIYIPYSGEEIRLEVRRINEQKNEDVLLFQKEIPDFNSVDWEEAESYENMPNGGGFNKKDQCHISPGHM